MILLGIALLAGIPVLFGSPRPMVRIQWRELPAADRVALEQKLGLTEPVQLDDDEWAYVPVDVSPETIRTIVRHPSAAATDGIDRRGFRIARSPPLSPRRGGLLTGASPWAARGVKLLAYIMLSMGAIVMLGALAASPRFRPRSRAVQDGIAQLLADPRATLTAAPAWVARGIERGVPMVSAETVGVFRIVFGTAVLWFALTHPVYPALLGPYEVASAEGPYGTVVRWLSDRPDTVLAIETYLMISGALFVVGLFTAVSFAIFVAAFFLWASVYTVTTSTHAVGVLCVALACLTVVRWGDAYSVDAWRRRTRGRQRPPASPRQYGLALWIPRLVMGLAFLAAAWSKAGNQFEWVWNGTVRYHFISDLEHALVPWGPALTQNRGMAVLMSGAAVAIESLLITAVFSSSEKYRLFLAAAAALLMAGFVLFQGVLWWAWWILLLAFLPWQRLRLPHLEVRGASGSEQAGMAVSQDSVLTGTAAGTSLTPIQRLAVGAVIALQLVASIGQIEARPFVSAYDMYSATYASAEDYESAANLVYRLVLFENGQPRDVPECLVDDRAAALVPAAAGGSTSERQRIRSLLAPCVASTPTATDFALEGDRQVYNWDERRFEWKRALDVVGPFPVDWLRDGARSTANE